MSPGHRRFPGGCAHLQTIGRHIMSRRRRQPHRMLATAIRRASRRKRAFAVEGPPCVCDRAAVHVECSCSVTCAGGRVGRWCACTTGAIPVPDSWTVATRGTDLSHCAALLMVVQAGGLNDSNEMLSMDLSERLTTLIPVCTGGRRTKLCRNDAAALEGCVGCCLWARGDGAARTGVPPRYTR